MLQGVADVDLGERVVTERQQAMVTRSNGLQIELAELEGSLARHHLAVEVDPSLT
jgi:long-subunit acyl-CoA synthetase (AMP-forming)